MVHPPFTHSLGFVVLLGWCCSPKLLLAVATGLEEAPRSRLTAKELRCGLLESQERIRSFKVSYRSETYTDPRAPTGSYLYRVVAAKCPCYFYHLNSHPCAAYSWTDDPTLRIAHIGETAGRTVAPFTNSYFVTAFTAESPLPGSLPRELFIQVTGIWPLVAREAPRWAEIPVALRDVARSEVYSEVRPTQEIVNDRWCHVLAWPGHDRLWIDVQRDCALLARESFACASGARTHRFELSEHRESAPGLWFPTRLRSIQFDYNAPTEEGRRRKVIDAIFTVETVEINNVSDSLFDFEPSPGALLEYDGRRKDRKYPVQAVPGGVELLDHLAEWVQCRVRQPREAGLWRSNSWCVGFLVFPMILLLEIVGAVRRRNR